MFMVYKAAATYLHVPLLLDNGPPWLTIGVYCLSGECLYESNKVINMIIMV